MTKQLVDHLHSGQLSVPGSGSLIGGDQTPSSLGRKGRRVIRTGSLQVALNARS